MSMTIKTIHKLPYNVPMLTSRSKTADFNTVQRALRDMFTEHSDFPALLVITKKFPDFGEEAEEYKGDALVALKFDILSDPSLRLHRMTAPSPSKLKGETVHSLLAKLHTAANNKVCACLAPHLSEHLKSTLSGKVGMTTTLSSRVLAATG